MNSPPPKYLRWTRLDCPDSTFRPGMRSLRRGARPRQSSALSMLPRWGDDRFPGEVFVADMRDAPSVNRALAEIVSRFEITGLVNNAGLSHLQKLGEIDLGSFDEV